MIIECRVVAVESFPRVGNSGMRDTGAGTNFVVRAVVDEPDGNGNDVTVHEFRIQKNEDLVKKLHYGSRLKVEITEVPE